MWLIVIEGGARAGKSIMEEWKWREGVEQGDGRWHWLKAGVCRWIKARSGVGSVAPPCARSILLAQINVCMLCAVTSLLQVLLWKL